MTMDDALFAHLLQSLKEASVIAKGTVPASRPVLPSSRRRPRSR
jgi:hypothetical protein